MAGDRRVHHTERSKWRYTFRRRAADALAALTASDRAPAQQAVAKIIDLACDLKRYDYFRSDDPAEAAKFAVSQAVAALWESVLRHDGFAALAGRAPEQLTRWEEATAGPAEATVRWRKRKRPWPFRLPSRLRRQICGGRSPSPTWGRWRRPDARTPGGRAPCTEPSMRPVTGARSGRTTSPRGTRCSSTGSRALPGTNCWTGSSPARRSPGRNSSSCARGSQSAVVTFPRPPHSVTKCLKEMPGRQA